MLSLLSYTGCVVNVVTVVGFRGRKRGCCVRMFVFRVFLFIADFPKKNCADSQFALATVNISIWC